MKLDTPDVPCPPPGCSRTHLEAPPQRDRLSRLTEGKIPPCPHPDRRAVSGERALVTISRSSGWGRSRNPEHPHPAVGRDATTSFHR